VDYTATDGSEGVGDVTGASPSFYTVRRSRTRMLAKNNHARKT